MGAIKLKKNVKIGVAALLVTVMFWMVFLGQPYINGMPIEHTQETVSVLVMDMPIRDINHAGAGEVYLRPLKISYLDDKGETVTLSEIPKGYKIGVIDKENPEAFAEFDTFYNEIQPDGIKAKIIKVTDTGEYFVATSVSKNAEKKEYHLEVLMISPSGTSDGVTYTVTLSENFIHEDRELTSEQIEWVT